MYGIKENQEQKLKKYERFKRFRVKSCRSISLPVKNMASGAPRGHITTGIFSTDKVNVSRSRESVIMITEFTQPKLSYSSFCSRLVKRSLIRSCDKSQIFEECKNFGCVNSVM